MNIKTWIAIVIALCVVGFFFFGDKVIGLFNSPTSSNTGSTVNVNPVTDSNSVSNNSLVIQDVNVGTGAAAKAGDTVTVNYVGKLQNGTTFDSSISHGQPFSFVLGSGQVIKGWDEGLVGMKVGGTRVLVIPASLAYGDRAVGSIPANSTLVFEVELLSVK